MLTLDQRSACCSSNSELTIPARQLDVEEPIMTMAVTVSDGRRLDGVALACIAVTILLWASSFPAIRVGLHALSPIELAGARYLAAAVPAALYLIVSRTPPPDLATLARL